MKTKIILLISLFWITYSTYSQKQVHFEQIAFEYYRDSILKDIHLQKKITISLKVVDNVSYWDTDCLKELNLKIDDTASAVVTAIGTKDLNLNNDKRFRKKKFKKKKLPMVFATIFLSFDSDKNIVGLVENNEEGIITYLFEINEVGEIKKWCKGELKTK